MRTEDFNFTLPRELIAQRPVMPREDARLLAVGASLRDTYIRDLPKLLRPGDLMVFNDTRVIPARLRGRRGQARIELLLHRPEAARNGLPCVWRAFARPARKLRPGDRVEIADGFTAQLLEKGEAGEVTVGFALNSEAFRAALERYGEAPLPPYIERPGGADARDRVDYQTIFAEKEGAVAAPTAGLHFTPALLDALSSRGVRRAGVTLHVGAGTFLPVKVERAEDHRMHGEWGAVGAEVVEAVAATQRSGGRVMAVGTTSLRLLEGVVRERGSLQPFSGEIDLFILPGYRFKVVDLLLTNFHLPCSTLFMLVAAFAGLERMKAAYAHAIRRRYRFYSYGDACLIERAAS